ncbi:MAG: ABC transporter permease [Pyrinomonadaceae bacterium]
MTRVTPASNLLEESASRVGHRHVKVIGPPSFSLLSLVRGLSTLRGYGDLLYTLSLHRVKVRYKQSLLGLAWAIVQPLSLMLIYTLVFSIIVKMPSSGVPYAVFAFVALLPWSYFSTALTNATNGLVSNASLVTKVYFPREILPLSYVTAALLDLLIASIIMAVLMVYYHIRITTYIFYAVPIIFVLTAFLTGISFFFSATQVRFRDIGMAMPLLLQLWMFATPVVYPLDRVPEWIRGVYILNPMVGVIENFRRVVLLGTAPDLYLLGVSAAISLILLPISYLYFKRVEATVADLI